MSLLGIDIGTTGYKLSAFTPEGKVLAFEYEEYPKPQTLALTPPGWAELDAVAVWKSVCHGIRRICEQTISDPIQALSVSALGEALTPVNKQRQILGPSILNFDLRGSEYVTKISDFCSEEAFFDLSGNLPGNHFSLTKLMWIKENQPQLYAATDYFLPWSSLIPFLLGAEPVVDYPQANRTLCFDVKARTWALQTLHHADLDPQKFPKTVPSGTVIGKIDNAIAKQLGMPPNVLLTSGAHDQCYNAIGCGVVHPGPAMYGMGTYLTITHVYQTPPTANIMIDRGLNVEHHAVPNHFVTFIYNQGGAILKWCRDVMANNEHQAALASGKDIYESLLDEMPLMPSGIMLLPHFMATATPEFLTNTCGIIAGLHTTTSRGQIIRGALEGMTFYLRQCVERLPKTEIAINEYRAVGGGSKSNAWLQLSADIMGQPFARPLWTEAGVLGAALSAGVASKTYSSFEDAVAAAVRIQQTFEPNPQIHTIYNELFAHYDKLWPIMREYLQKLDSIQKLLSL